MTWIGVSNTLSWASLVAQQWRLCLQCRLEFNPCVGEISWRRVWQPTLVFLPGDPKDRGAWRATVHRVIMRRTQLKQLGTKAHKLSVLQYDMCDWHCGFLKHLNMTYQWRWLRIRVFWLSRICNGSVLIMESQEMTEVMLDIYRWTNLRAGGKKPKMGHQFFPRGTQGHLTELLWTEKGKYKDLPEISNWFWTYSFSQRMTWWSTIQSKGPQTSWDRWSLVLSCSVPLPMGFPRQEYWSEWYAVSSSRGSSWTRNQIRVF